MIHTYVVVDGHECRVQVPYEARDSTKGIPGRQWDNDSKHWVFPAREAGYVAQRLRSRGIICKVVNATPVAATGNWAERVFTNNCDKPIYRKLSRKLHPDVGGDGELQQQLNDAWQDCGCADDAQ